MKNSPAFYLLYLLPEIVWHNQIPTCLEISIIAPLPQIKKWRS